MRVPDQGKRGPLASSHAGQGGALYARYGGERGRKPGAREALA
ncbi:MAG: hypothetical protein QM690_20170 [Sphingobium sp.]